ncbi:MAG: MFS transporter, partial [Bellilinea sp.]
PPTMFGLAIGVYALTGFALPITNGPIFAVIQGTVSPEMQGRVVTLIGSAATAMMPVSLMIAGPVADRFGLQTWYIIGGAACFLIALFSLSSRALINIEAGPPGKLAPRLESRIVD